MTFDDFLLIIKQVQAQNPILFELEHDNIPNSGEILDFETRYDFKLPGKYKKFISVYGGGYFGFANIYSLDRDSDFCILKHNSFPTEYLSISDNGCGDFYMLKIEDNICSENLYFYDHETSNISGTPYQDVLEYLIEVGLNA